jgi:hypothetical protein
LRWAWPTALPSLAVVHNMNSTCCERRSVLVRR